MEQAFSFGAKFATPTFLATGLTRRKIDTNIANNNAGDDLSQYILEVDISSDDPNHVPQMSTSKSTKSKIQAKTVIIASGTNPRKLDLPHEKSLWGNSIHNCALCDGDAYAPSNLNNQHHPSNGNTQMHPKNGKSVVVIGGGDAAIEAISLLSRVGVETIHWIHRRNEFKASAIEVERVRQLPNVQIWTPYVVVEWIVKENGVVNGEDGNNPAPLILDGVRIVGSNNGIADPEATSSLTINCDGAFLMIGSTPNTRWLQDSGIEIDQTSGLIQHTPTISLGGVNSASFSTATSIPGVFAAGEAVDPIYRCVSVLCLLCEQWYRFWTYYLIVCFEGSID